RGVIQLNNETYVIHPLDGGDHGEDRAHIIYKGTNSGEEKCGNSEGKWLPFHELHKGDFGQDPTIGTPEVKSKFLKLALVVDNSMYWGLNRTIVDMFRYSALTANIVDMYFKELNIDVGLSYVELWNLENQITVTQRLRETLENFMMFQTMHLGDTDYHTAHLISHAGFEDNFVGMAIPDSMCTSRASGINWNPGYLQIQQGATILAHMIAHNLGIKHDEDGGCACNDEFGCIMSTEPVFPQTCGNRHVERGEECDCGTPECPVNNYAKDGHTCNNHTGYCMGGVCPTLDKQCQHIWGTEASTADHQCYERFNPTGNFNGHCGKDNSTGSFAKCMPEDIPCGLLHCSGGHHEPLYGPDKDSSKTTFSSNGLEFECKTVYGPSTLALPNLGIVLDGTRCGDDHVCMNRKCVPLANLAPLKCPGTSGDVVCSGHGICTKEDTCFCEDMWAGVDCSLPLNESRPALSLHSLLTTTPAPPTTQKNVKAIPLNVTLTTKSPQSTDVASAAVVQANESSWMDTKWMMIILASVVGGLALLFAMSFLCYRRRSPMSSRQKKKKLARHCEEGETESANKLIKFGSLPSYRDEKKKKKKTKKKSKGSKSASESDMDLPPPPMIISDPNSAKPEKGILKGAYSAMKYANDRRSSESNTATSSSKSERDSVGPYDEIDEEDTEAGEIQDIFGTSEEPEKSVDALDNMIESSSFDFMLPPPFSNLGLQNRSPSPPRKFGGYDMAHLTQRPNVWMQNLQSPPKSRVLRMRNLDELLQTIDRNTIDLSPSPDDPPVQISPSTSEDVRSSSTEDHRYPASSQDPQSPNSITSGSTCTALRPLLGSQWSKYVLHHNNPDGGIFSLDDIESPLPHINIPPPMNPINIRSIFNYGQKGINSRDNNDTPLGSQNGECSSNNGTANSRNGYEKSSGYGSEHDPERFSIEDLSRNQSRSGSASPPSFSAVIRTGPNQIKLVPASKKGGYSYNPMDNDLQKLLDGVPRIDAGCYERSPILLKNGSNSETLSSVTSGTSTLDTLKNSMSECPSSMNSETNTLVNSEYETMDLLSNEDGSLHEQYPEMEGSCSKDFTDVKNMQHPLPDLPDGVLPNPKPLGDTDYEQTESSQCIDRSLEEISHLDNRKHNKNHKRSAKDSRAQRPLSLGLSGKETNSDEVASERDSLLVNRFSAIEPQTVDICEC
ncbi:UNC71-like protein, partial [Mya arenaria]